MCRAHGARAGRRPVARAQPRDTAPWTRDHRRRRREHRDRRSDARRRARLADAEVRPRARQPAGRRPGDGRRHACVRASADENPDLFWAIRGGGGNFGIATSLEYTLHPVGPTITGGVVVHPFPRALDVLRFFRDTCASLPDEAMLVAALQTAPDGSKAKVAGIVGGHCGPLDQGEAAFRPLKAFGPPVMDAMGPMPYATLNGMIDPAFPKGALNYWKAQFLTDLSDDAIRALIAGFEACPSPMSAIVIEHFHGAASRVPVTATACTMRVTGFNVVIASQWMDRGRDGTRHRVGARDLCVAHAVSCPDALRQLPGRRCGRPRRGRVRTEPAAAERDQGEVRPGRISSGRTSTFCRSELKRRSDEPQACPSADRVVRRCVHGDDHPARVRARLCGLRSRRAIDTLQLFRRCAPDARAGSYEPAGTRSGSRVRFSVSRLGSSAGSRTGGRAAQQPSCRCSISPCSGSARSLAT